MAYTIPRIGPPVIPCTPIDNIITDNYSPYNINFIYSGSAYATIGGYGVEVLYKNTSAQLEIDFHGNPSNGIYTTCNYNSFSFNNKNVYVRIKSGMSEFTVNSGGLIYIEEIDNELFTITFCELTYSAFSSDFPLAGKILIHK
jgi:FlaG/FlaF family flagellin (archaellin)